MPQSRLRKVHATTSRITQFDKRSKLIGRLTKLGLSIDTIVGIMAERGVPVTKSQVQYHGSVWAYGYREKIRKGQTNEQNARIAAVFATFRA